MFFLFCQSVVPIISPKPYYGKKMIMTRYTKIIIPDGTLLSCVRYVFILCFILVFIGTHRTKTVLVKMCL